MGVWWLRSYKLFLMDSQTVFLLFAFLLLPTSSIREVTNSFHQFQINPSTTNEVWVELPPFTAALVEYTIDLTFRIDTLALMEFKLLTFDNAGFTLNGNTLGVVSFPTTCTLSSSFEANRWTQVTLAVTSSRIEYYLNQVRQFYSSTGYPTANLNPLSLLMRPAGSSTPSKITLSNLKVFNNDWSVLKFYKLINYYLPQMTDLRRVYYIYHIQFI